MACLSYQRVLQYCNSKWHCKGFDGRQPAKFGASAHGGEGAIEAVRAAGGKKKTRKARVCRSCHIKCIDKDIQCLWSVTYCAWKSCCNYTVQLLYSHRTGACTGADLPIIASGVQVHTVKAVGFYFFIYISAVPQKGIVSKEVYCDLRGTGNCALQYSWHERYEMR